MIVGLALFARERASRIAHALALIDDLDRERERALTEQRRIGETAAANLDRGSLERIIVATAVELVGGDFGRLSIAARADEPLSSRVCHSSANGHVALIEQVERSAAEGAGSVRAIAPDGSAMALRLDRPDVARCVLSVARSGRPFTMREQELLRTHAEQASVCLQNVALHERVERLAGTDELTGLLNHRRLQEILGREVRRAERHGGALALVMLDIDNFKAINDVYGHQQGDAVLRAVSATLQSSIRAIDFAARYGGEELAVVLPDCEIGQAATTAERIRHAIASLHVPLRCGRTISVTASLGVASLDVETRTRQQLVEAADAALYVAKRAGKNRVEVAAGVVVA
jgi:diguanylate cyclase (GGDEF)-like protein